MVTAVLGDTVVVTPDEGVTCAEVAIEVTTPDVAATGDETDTTEVTVPVDSLDKGVETALDI